MPDDPCRPVTLEPRGMSPGPAGPIRARVSPARSRLISRWWAAIPCGLIGCGLLALFIRAELDPADLAAADQAYRRNDMETALGLADAYLARRPSNRRAALLAARCLSRLGRPDRAEANYQRAAPLSIDDQHIRAYALVVNNRREQAIRAYHEILEPRPDDVLALSRLAAVLISEKRWPEILEISGRLIKIPVGAVIGHSMAGVVHHNTGDSELAVFAFSRVLELDPKLERMPLKPRSMFWSEYGYNLLMVSRWAEARHCLYRALEDGNDAKVADLLGQSYFIEGDFDEAERCWRLALEWDSNRYGTWWRIGKLELQRGRPAEALEPLRRSAELEPRATGPLYNLIIANRLLGRDNESRRLMSQIETMRGGRSAVPRAAMDSPRIETDEISRQE